MDDLKSLAIVKSFDVQIELAALDYLGKTNHMELAIDNCSTRQNYGTKKEFHLAGSSLKTDREIEDLGTPVSKNTSMDWSQKQQTEKNWSNFL